MSSSPGLAENPVYSMYRGYAGDVTSSRSLEAYPFWT